MTTIHAYCLAENTHRWLTRVGIGKTTFAGGNSSTQEYSGSISGICTASTLSISRFCTADTACTIKTRIRGFDSAATYLPVLSVFRTAHTLSTLGICAFAGLAVFWPPVLQYSQHSDYEMYSVLRVLGTSICETYIFTLSAEKHIF